MDNREIILTRRELKIYSILKKELSDIIDVTNELLDLGINVSFILVKLNNVEISPFFLREIRRSDFITKFPYEPRYFLITAQNNSLADSFDFINRLEGLLNRKYSPAVSKLKYSILALEKRNEASKILFEIMQIYKKMKKSEMEYKKL